MSLIINILGKFGLRSDFNVGKVSIDVSANSIIDPTTLNTIIDPLNGDSIIDPTAKA